MYYHGEMTYGSEGGMIEQIHYAVISVNCIEPTSGLSATNYNRSTTYHIQCNFTPRLDADNPGSRIGGSRQIRNIIPDMVRTSPSRELTTSRTVGQSLRMMYSDLGFFTPR
jgi:hypothetical protein